MPKTRSRKPKPSGVLTFVIIAAALASLFFVGSWLKGRQPRRLPLGAAGMASETPGALQDEILPEERDALDRVLKQGGRQ